MTGPAVPAAPAPHPTVPYGQPGQVGFDGRAPGAPAPAAPAPAAPNGGPPVNQPFAPPAAPAAPAAPHPTAPFGQPGYAAPGAPAAPAPAGQPSGVDPNQVIQAGPGVPAELVGRTVGQAFQIYSALATEWIRRTPQGGGTQAPPPAPGAPAPAQPNQPAPGAPRPAAGDFWRDPEANIQRIVEATVARAVAPANAAAQEQEVVRARDIAIAGIPDVQQLWPTMVAALQGVDPSGLTDPRVWERAADMARGQLMKQGQYRPVAPAAPNGAPPAPNNQPFTAAGGRPSIPGNQPGAAILPQTAFFTESPSTPGAGGPYNPGLSADEANVAQKFGMSPQEYAAWKGGVSRGR